jgi:sulfur carrier protein
LRVRVVINGELREVVDGLTVAALIQHLGLRQRRIAVEVNRAIVAREP